MKIKVNNEWVELNEEHELISLLKRLSLETKHGIAVAVNAEVISRKSWSEFLLKEMDEVLIIEAAQGG